MTEPPRIKFCGITGLDDAQRAIEAGAWALGVILWPGSPRRCPLPAAERIVATLRRQAEICGVFVNAPLDELAATVDAVGLTMVQLHGDEGPAYCSEVARRTGAKVIKAARVSGGADIAALEPFHTDFHLLDTYQPGQRGGTGETFDWDLVHKRRSTTPLILSGGLTPENVGAAIAATHPFAVDTASGTEVRPGVKDPEKLRAFAAAVQATAPQPAEANS
ncbi:MAG: phosphoribosylanthranilate isomerase [Solirubrobacteraceae bacterium]|nr:phosphoribosylanthranilate isomerase [Solirubrobacteraceae bacterium]MEA2290872.1 phosphoribosylanthranilate isomerase [Solirubrobacteraceae bacterium]